MAQIETDLTTFRKIKSGWDRRLAQEDWEGFDMELLPILKLFNQIFGVATFMSCASHPEKAGNDLRRTDFYITFAFREVALPHLLGIFAELRDRFIDRWPEHKSKISPRYLHFSCGVRTLPIRDTDGPMDWWNSACLSVQLPPVDPQYKNKN